MDTLPIYRNIKRLRLEKEWSQTDLAKKIGYSDKSMIAKIENGKVDLTQSKVVDFANVFGVTPSALMGWDTEDESVNEIAAAIVMHDEDKALLDAYHNADDLTKQMVKKLLGM